MRKSLAGVVAFAFLVPMLVAFAPHTSASAPIRTVTEIVSIDNTITVEPVNDRVIKLSFVSDQQWRGDWNGRNVFVGQAVVRSGTPPSMITVQAVGTFEGTVLGMSGTVTLVGRTIFRSDGTFAMDQYTVLSGTGDLANLRGHLGHDVKPPDFADNAQQIFWVHFDP